MKGGIYVFLNALNSRRDEKGIEKRRGEKRKGAICSSGANSQLALELTGSEVSYVAKMAIYTFMEFVLWNFPQKAVLCTILTSA